MSEAKEFNFIGQRTIRPDGHDKVTGKANYAADLALPGMIWGKILRSPHAHAKILKLDTSRAEAMSGVMSVATFDDLPSVSNEAIQSGEGAIDSLDLGRNVLARDKVLYHGHAIVAIAAKTEAIAEKALDRKTGARGLRAVMEETMLDMMYELPSQEDIEEVVINKEVVANGEKPMMVYAKKKQAS